jgi:hypothetical protein
MSTGANLRRGLFAAMVLLSAVMLTSDARALAGGHGYRRCT